MQWTVGVGKKLEWEVGKKREWEVGKTHVESVLLKDDNQGGNTNGASAQVDEKSEESGHMSDSESTRAGNKVVGDGDNLVDGDCGNLVDGDGDNPVDDDGDNLVDGDGDDSDSEDSSGTSSVSEEENVGDVLIPDEVARAIYIDNVPEPRRWTDQACQREKERVWPEVRCVVRPLRSGGIMITNIRTYRELRAIKETDFLAPVNGGPPPFGGSNKVTTKDIGRFPNERSVRMVVAAESNPRWVRQRLDLDGYPECVVVRVGKPFGGRNGSPKQQAVRVVLKLLKDTTRIVKQGLI